MFLLSRPPNMAAHRESAHAEQSPGRGAGYLAVEPLARRTATTRRGVPPRRGKRRCAAKPDRSRGRRPTWSWVLGARHQRVGVTIPATLDGWLVVRPAHRATRHSCAPIHGSKRDRLLLEPHQLRHTSKGVCLDFFPPLWRGKEQKKKKKSHAATLTIVPRWRSSNRRASEPDSPCNTILYRGLGRGSSGPLLKIGRLTWRFLDRHRAKSCCPVVCAAQHAVDTADARCNSA